MVTVYLRGLAQQPGISRSMILDVTTSERPSASRTGSKTRDWVPFRRMG